MESCGIRADLGRILKFWCFRDLVKSLGEFWKFWGTVIVSLETGEQSWSLGSSLGVLGEDLQVPLVFWIETTFLEEVCLRALCPSDRFSGILVDYCWWSQQLERQYWFRQ